jgi:hypothetical protein
VIAILRPSTSGSAQNGQRGMAPLISRFPSSWFCLALRAFCPCAANARFIRSAALVLRLAGIANRVARTGAGRSNAHFGVICITLLRLFFRKSRSQAGFLRMISPSASPPGQNRCSGKAKPG